MTVREASIAQLNRGICVVCEDDQRVKGEVGPPT